jgi:hypothetical protein
VIGSLIFPKKEQRQEHISELQPQRVLSTHGLLIYRRNNFSM